MTNTNINENRTTDVVLFAIHTRSVDRYILQPTVKCLAKKAARGVYDKEKALKAFYNAVNAILKDFYSPWFNRYHGTSCSWYRIASTDERRVIFKGYISTPEQFINVLIPYVALMLPFMLIAALAKIDSMREERKEVK